MGNDSQLGHAYFGTNKKTEVKPQDDIWNSQSIAESISDMQLIRSVCMEIIKLEKAIEVERDFLAL